MKIWVFTRHALRKMFAHAKAPITTVGLQKDKDVLERILEKVTQRLFDRLTAQERSDSF